MFPAWPQDDHIATADTPQCEDPHPPASGPVRRRRWIVPGSQNLGRDPTAAHADDDGHNRPLPVPPARRQGSTRLLPQFTSGGLTSGERGGASCVPVPRSDRDGGATRSYFRAERAWGEVRAVPAIISPTFGLCKVFVWVCSRPIAPPLGANRFGSWSGARGRSS